MLLMMILATAVIIGGGVYAIARMTRQPEGVKRLLEAPRVSIRDAPDASDARIEGVVETLDETLEAPIGGGRCVYFELTVREVEDVGAMHGSVTVGGRVVHRAAKGVPFIVRDDTGYAIVDPEGATALIGIDEVVESSQGSAMRMLVRAVGFPMMSRPGAAHEVRMIEPGDRIVVIGRGTREPDPDPKTVDGTYRDGPATRLRLMHSPQFPLHLLDESPGGRK